MGIFVNPDHSVFQVMLNSEIIKPFRTKVKYIK